MDAVTIPVMAKARIGHFVESQILESLGVDYIDESEVLTPAAISLARSVGAKGFKIVGCTCVGQDLQLRGVHYQEVFAGHAGNNYTSEALLSTGGRCGSSGWLL